MITGQKAGTHPGEATSHSQLKLLLYSKLIVGLESPTHALRADADPSAQSASATYITLAQEHPYDRNIEIILHLSGEQLGAVPSCVIFPLVFMWLHWLTNLLHRTSQSTGHIRERQALFQPVWRADLFSQRFHPLHSKRFGGWKEGWW